VEKNDNFRLPEESRYTCYYGSAPETGYRTFRAFMQQREADEAQGKMVVLGNPIIPRFFYIQVGVGNDLSKMALSTKLVWPFSRDQNKKCMSTSFV